MTRTGFILVGLAIATATSALAFQEQRSGAQVGGAAGQVGQEQAPAAKPAGTEVRIPGLGKLGTLPKMDFGLELLYGAADPKAQLDQAPAGTPVPSEDQDLTIRGTVKHRF